MYKFPVAYFNSNNGIGRLAFGEGPMIKLSDENPLEELQAFIDEHEGKHLLVNLSYDLKNHVEDLTSKNPDYMNFPLGYAWVPKYMVDLEHENLIFVQGEKNSEALQFLDHFMQEEIDENFQSFPHKLTARISKEEYIKNVKSLKEHIQNGDIYEVNYCQEFFAEDVEIPHKLDAYFKLNYLTRAPYSSFFFIDQFTLLCGSPERFLYRKGNRLISEPIKGTTRRGKTPEEDEALKEALLNDPKERSENVMIVDLVRNDLSRIALPNSVEVEELFGIYSFETVHQMISRIGCNISEETSFTDILRSTFPMGSMTGAPKISAMKLIEEHECFQRGIYSGSIGYIRPNGDFDFNVVIRTLVYNHVSKYLSCAVGGAITIKSDPEKEYEECNIKVKGILDGMNE
ncbi:MAG: anthranilate synthase component I family protein [Flavobacteriales bacterium]|nr:anthranilate synthase component I family protein [Flavobacteriales bacterium]PIE86908.1 MAG: aminodeoxychorismate synthase component I [Bacteroidota bacterium]